MSGYLSEAELAAVSILPRSTPYAITNVSRTQFSIARYYGGITYSGEKFTYIPEHDELVRDDVLGMVKTMRRMEIMAQRAESAEKQLDLGLDP